MLDLLPKPAEASATVTHRRARWLGFALTPRALWLLAGGLVLALPAFFYPRLIWMMPAWDALVLALAAMDAALLPAAGAITAKRSFLSLPMAGRRVQVRLELRQTALVRMRVRAMDSLHAELERTPVFHPLMVWRNDPAVLTLDCWPSQRGDLELGPVYLRYRSAAGLAERRTLAPLQQTVRVAPSSLASDEDSIALLRARQAELERRRIRRIGLGREFETLREYQPGDELRHISWTATARRGKPIVRTFTAERSQQVWAVVDAGRLSRTSFRLPLAIKDRAKALAGRGEIEYGEQTGLDLTQLDQSASAALLLAQVADRAGDRSALLAYGRQVQQQILPGKGHVHLRRMMEALSLVRAERTEADHRRAAMRLRQLQSRRGLIFWISEVGESVALPEAALALMDLARNHLCVLLLVEHPELEQFARSAPQDAEQMFAVAAANEVLERRRAVVAQLLRRGVMVVETSPAEVGLAAINQYLEIKARGTL
jgi:uncharacterized protein (DUF58 family)